jgi:hypothetical protein
VSEENVIRKLITALVLLLTGGAASAYMLLHLDREAQRLLDGQKYWYGDKKGENESDEFKKIKRNITVLYAVLLVVSIAATIFFSLKLAKKIGWL